MEEQFVQVHLGKNVSESGGKCNVMVTSLEAMLLTEEAANGITWRHPYGVSAPEA